MNILFPCDWIFLSYISLLTVVWMAFLDQAEVAAGSINLNGKITVEVQRQGGETAIGDIVRLVEEAQTREAPVQRLADKVHCV